MPNRWNDSTILQSHKQWPTEVTITRMGFSGGTGIEGLKLGNPFLTHDMRHLIFFGEQGPAITPYWVDAFFIEDLRANALAPHL